MIGVSATVAGPGSLVQRSWVTCSPAALVGPAASTLLEQAQELTGLCFIHIDLAAGQRFFSKNYEKVLGIPVPTGPDELLHHIHPDDRAAFQAVNTKAFSTPGKHSWSCRFVTRSGEVRWIETIADNVVDRTGATTRVLLTCRNVSDSRQSTLGLQSSVELLRRVQSTARIGVWETDLVTGKEHWSPEAWALIEPGGAGEPSTERWLAAVHPDDREIALEGYCRAIETGSSDDEVRVVHPDGSLRWHRGLTTVEFDADGKPLVMRGMVADVTERRQTKSAMSKLAQIIEAMPLAVAWSDLEGRLVYVNPTGRSMLGLAPDATIEGMRAAELLAPHERVRIQAMRKTVASEGIWRGEVDMLASNGRIFPASVVRVLHRDANGRPAYNSIICRDISEARAAEQALRDADRRKDEFLATLAHELRNPLAPLQSAADVMRQMEAADARLPMLRRIVEQQTSHLKRLIDDLLDVSRLASGKLTLQKAPASLGEAIRSAVEMCQTEIAARGHGLALALPPDETLLRIDGDLFRLTQVLANLIGNAAKYTQDGGRIRVGVHCDAHVGVITVEDNGVGIAPEFLPKVFDAFAQAADQRQRAAGGLGLGLMLVKQIVELHGGTVSAASDGLGRGSRFEVRLPLLAAATSAAPASTRGASGPSARSNGVRVLVVDDYAAIRDSMELMLTMRGFAVATAESGQKALANMAAFAPDVVLLDIRMPGMSGLELAKALRARPGGDKLRLIGMTGNGNAEERRIALASGFDEQVVKPLSVDRLVALLKPADDVARAVA